MSPKRSSADAPSGKGSILVVDDVADNRALLSRRFQQRGYAVAEAESGEQALAMIAAETYDLVLLDIMMPDLDGFKVLERVRRDFTPEELPIIMVTARSENSDVVAALNLGANDYVMKPIEFAVVLARASGQIERRRAGVALRDANAALQNTNDALLSANEQLRQQMARQRAFEDRIDYLAHYDPLTGLPNRQLFTQRLRDASGYARRMNSHVAVLYVALEGVRNVNEALGHTVADCLIKTLAGRLHGVLDEMDVPGRLGSHEFGIIHVSSEAPATAASLAARLIELVRSCRDLEGHPVLLRAGIGIALDDGLTEPVELIQMADLAMARASAQGSERYRFFHPDMNAEVRARRRLETDLRTAVAEMQFEIHYQPIYDLKQQRVSVFEGLLRWEHPQRGFVSPTEVIPLAESTGLIVPLGEWVIRTACLEAMNWPPDVKVAVNVSPIQFRDGQLPLTVRRALEESGLPATRLQIEITESVLLGDSEANLEVLRELRSLGVQIAMDDFGTGYSSLSYLRSFRFDKVKLDKSFVRHMCDEEQSRAIVQAVAGLGASFGMTVTAEGVETQEQLACLSSDGYHEIQGFLLGRPQPASRIFETGPRSFTCRAA